MLVRYDPETGRIIGHVTGTDDTDAYGYDCGCMAVEPGTDLDGKRVEINAMALEDAPDAADPDDDTAEAVRDRVEAALADDDPAAAVRELARATLDVSFEE